MKVRPVTTPHESLFGSSPVPDINIISLRLLWTVSRGSMCVFGDMRLSTGPTLQDQEYHVYPQKTLYIGYDVKRVETVKDSPFNNLCTVPPTVHTTTHRPESH